MAAKPTLSTKRIPFQLGVGASESNVVPPLYATLAVGVSDPYGTVKVGSADPTASPPVYSRT